MRRLILTSVMALLCLTSTYSQRACGAMDHLHHQLQQDPKQADKMQQIENHTLNYIKNHSEGGDRAVVTIPVVFHVVYRTSTENISAAQLQTQLDVLNEDFRRLNADQTNLWSQAADAEVEFCLATVDPSGNSTSGITRTSTNTNGFGTNDAVKFNSSGGKDAWPSGDYLNFWVCNIGGGILGYAQFPGGDPATDGVVNDYRYTGTIGTAQSPFDLGRTATHEVGHWLNLRHIWGDGNCNADDFVSDTPTSDAPNYGCATGHVSCNSTDMSTVASGGTYGSQPDGSTVNIEACLVDGCYDFTITDAYGDGICCSYGNGSYTVSSGGSTLASGGAFGSSETTNICVGGSNPPAPTCTDGIQNGSETGIDCGGPDCNACPSCNDGIQNGNETGVDCGGPDCNACPTCSDGIQNGDETGVDCGGSCDPCNTGGGSDLLLGSYFETGLDGWIDGGSDCYRYTGSRSWEGSKSMRLRDNSGAASSMTSPALNLSGYSSVEVTFYFYPNSMETGEDFWLRYNDGSGWQTVATWASGSDFSNNTFYTATVPLSASAYNLTSNGRFRFQCDASANADRVYIDEVTIVGNNGSNRLASNSPSMEPLRSEPSTDVDTDITVYPNPTLHRLTVEAEETLTQLQVTSMTGQVLMTTKTSTNSTTVDVSQLPSGVYMLSVQTEEETTTKKFVKL